VESSGVQWNPISPVHHYLLLIDINYEYYKKSENALLNDRPELLSVIRITSVILQVLAAIRINHFVQSAG
jgi:hypothetical protein